MRNLKKLLAVIVAICLVATLSVPAFAADSFTYGTQAQTLHDLGLYAGTTTDTFTPDLGSALDRQTGIVLLLRVFGLEKKALAMTDAEVTTALTGFTDADKLPTWAKKQMAYAIANKIVAGTSATTVGGADALTGKQYAAFILRQLGYPTDTAALVDAATTTLADKGGLTADQATAFATKAMTKDDLVGMTFGTLKAKDSTGKTVIDNLVAGGVVGKDAAVKAGLTSGEVTATAAVTGAKKITVTFNQAIDTTKATFVVKRDTTTLNQASVTFADDKKSADITLAGKLLEGDYTVTVKGLTTTDIALTIAGIKDETPTKITLNGTTAAAIKDTTGFVTGASIGYKVLNQYGEDITSSAPNITWNSTMGSPSDNNGSGTVKITGIPNTTLIGQTFVLTGVLTDNGNAVVVTQTLTIGNQVALDSITFDKIYNSDGKTLATDSDFSTFTVIISSAKDQYGNDMGKDDLNKDLVASISNPSVITLPDTTKPITDKNGATGDKLGIAISEPTNNIDGTATIRLISRSTGKTFTFDVTVAKQSHVDTIKLQAPADAVALNDDVEIPFTALDQNGAAVTDFGELTADVRLVPGDSASAASSGYLRFVHDYVKNVGVLKFQAPNKASGSYVLMAFVSSNGKSSQLTLNIKDTAVPTYVAGVTSDVVPNLAVNATQDLKDSFINVNDNYDRSFDLSAKLDSHEYRILVKCDAPSVSTDASKDSKVTISGTQKITDAVTGNTLGYAVTASSDTVSKVTLTATAKGTSTIDLVLQKSTDGGVTYSDVDGSTYSLRVNVTDVAGIKSYTMDTIGTLYDQLFVAVPPLKASDYNKDVTVYGVKADGSKVTMAAKDYSVDTDNAGLVAVGKTLTAHGVLAKATDDDATVTVVVTISADGAPTILTQAVTVSGAAPKVASLALDTGYDKAAGKYEDVGLVSAKPVYSLVSPTTGQAIAFDYSAVLALAQAAIIAKDQYGVQVPSLNYITKVIVTNLGSDKTINGVGTASATNLVAGDTFNVTALGGGKSLTFKVVLK